MKKTIIATAIAATTFAGNVLAQDEQTTATPADLATLMDSMNSMPTVYGNIQLVYTYTDSDLTGGGGQLQDNGTTIGVKHSAEIMPGVEAYGKIELEGIKADNKDNRNDGAGATELDEAYIGVSGDNFGEIWVGSDDSQYEVLLGDYGNWIYEVATLNPYASYTTGEGDLIQYVSPSFGGLTLHGDVQIHGSDDDYDNDGERDGKNSYPYQLGASYDLDGLTVSVVMDSNDNGSANNENSYGIAFEYAINDLVLDAYYDHRKGVDVDEADVVNLTDPEEGGLKGGFVGDAGRDQLGLMGTYNIGANTFRLSYERADADTVDLTSDIYMFQALHNLNDNMYVYVEGGFRSNDGDDADEDLSQLNVGAVYYF